MKLIPYHKNIIKEKKSTYRDFSEDLSGPGCEWITTSQKWLMKEGGMIKLENHYSVSSIEIIDSGMNYQLLSKPRGKQFAETKVTTYILSLSLLLYHFLTRACIQEKWKPNNNSNNNNKNWDKRAVG